MVAAGGGARVNVALASRAPPPRPHRPTTPTTRWPPWSTETGAAWAAEPAAPGATPRGVQPLIPSKWRLPGREPSTDRRLRTAGCLYGTGRAHDHAGVCSAAESGFHGAVLARRPWQTVPGGVVAGNTLVWRHLHLRARDHGRIRLLVSGSQNGWSEVAEIEAWSVGKATTTPPTVSSPASDTGASALAPASFTVAADASDAEGPVGSVGFYANG